MEIKIPEVGESVREALLAKWFRQNGDPVRRDDPLCEIETDKITLDLNAEQDGVLSILAPEGATVAVGTVIARISEQSAALQPPSATSQEAASPGGREEAINAALSSPTARRELRAAGIDPQIVSGTGKSGRITPDDVAAHLQKESRRSWEPAPLPDDEQHVPGALPAASPPASEPPDVQSTAGAQPGRPALVRSEEAPLYSAGRSEERKPLSPIRKRIAERLLAARQQTAMLTTFNEADLSRVKSLREKFRQHFLERHGTPLGLMPFFVKACVEALKEFPSVNASIDANDIVYHHFYDIGIAIGGEKGLVVPILRNADKLRMFEIDQAIGEFVDKIKNNHLAISDLEGGTFTISNGGVYGSLLSTPILNPPQTGVLGMHAIQERAVVRDGQILIRPMMYLALSYDHRLIDGREAVGFLARVKQYIEEPEELLLEG
jgi:2-oxoglutarate dehydrogenase E2 component (dihydrolipoamide succinyltransferase)